MGRYSIDSVQLHNDGMGAAVNLRCVTQAAIDSGLTVTTPQSGNPFPEVAFIVAQNPKINWQTMALKQILDNVSITSGLCLVNTANPGLRFYGQAHNACGTNGRASGSVNMMATIGDGQLFPTQIECAAGADATISLETVALSDAGASPLALVFNAALPSTLVTDEVFTLGPARIGGVDIPTDALKSASVRFGINYTVIGSVGSIYPKAIIIPTVTPMIELRVDNPDVINNSGVHINNGLACAHADSFVSFVKRTANGGLVALNASSHIKITFKGLCTWGNVDASGSDVAGVQLNVNCIQPSGSVPLIAATTAALA